MIGLPLSRHPWSKILPGLWQGGHDYQPGGPGTDTLDAVVDTQFDAVVSLYRRRNADHGPAEGVEHIVHLIRDGQLDRADVRDLRDLAGGVARTVAEGKRVLVRCQAGYNRSGLVVAFALLHMGYTADDAITLIRTNRSQYALSNSHFVRYIREAAGNG